MQECIAATHACIKYALLCPLSPFNCTGKLSSGKRHEFPVQGTTGVSAHGLRQGNRVVAAGVVYVDPFTASKQITCLYAFGYEANMCKLSSYQRTVLGICPILPC
jgi:hypothetical protein